MNFKAKFWTNSSLVLVFMFSAFVFDTIAQIHPTVKAIGNDAARNSMSSAAAVNGSKRTSNQDSASRSTSFLAMTDKEKSDFVARAIDDITMNISGKKYAFGANFWAEVLRAVEGYARRVGNDRKQGFGQDLKFVMQRGSEFAPTINGIFDKNGVSRFSGLYIAMIESEFNNAVMSPTGSSGAFALTATQAKKYGMGKDDRSVLGKAAEIAARVLAENQKYFGAYKMNEYLAVMSWNRDVKKIRFDLNFKFMSDSENVACPICGLSENPKRFDQQFQIETVKYLPKFFAAAIVGENPVEFGLETKPLSTLVSENR